MNNDKDPAEYLTLDELKLEFPHAASIFHWTNRRLTAAIDLGILDGKPDKTLKRMRYTRGSIIEYIKYARKRMEDKVKLL